MTWRLTALCILALSAVPASAGDDYSPLSIAPRGAVEGGDALYIPHGDILNVRNVQGGTVGDPNLDVGAGSTEAPGTLSLNYDVGRKVVVYDGHKRPLAVFGPGRRIRFYVRPRIVKAAAIPVGG